MYEVGSIQHVQLDCKGIVYLTDDQNVMVVL